MAAIIEKDHISEYIPHERPMVMIDTLDYCEGTTTKTSFTVDDDNLFVKDGVLHEPGLIENIAQTAAVRVGYEIKKNGTQPLLGFIGAIKDLKIYALPKIGDTLHTTVIVKTQIMSVTIIEGVSYCGDKKIAECEMKIFIQKPDQKLA